MLIKKSKILKKIKHLSNILIIILLFFRLKSKNKIYYAGYCKFSLPWWFRVISYILSLVFSLVSIFLTILKGISIRNDNTTDWLISITLAFTIDNIILEPFQVCYHFLFLCFNYSNKYKLNI